MATLQVEILGPAMVEVLVPHAGGGGRVYLEAPSSLINNASSTNSNLVAYRWNRN